MVALAAARRATAVIVVPQFGAEAAVEQPLRRRILDEPGLPYVLVEIDPAWRVSGDVHPNARGLRDRRCRRHQAHKPAEIAVMDGLQARPCPAARSRN